MNRRHRFNIRTRLTLWQVGVLATVLLIYSASASLLLLHDLRAQLVRFAIQDLETVEGLLYFEPDGTLHFHDDYHNHPESKLIQERLLEVRDLSGKVLYRNQRLGNQPMDGDPLPREGENSYSAREVILGNGTRVQLVSRKHSVLGRPMLIRVAYSEEPFRDQFKAELLALLGPLPFILGLTGAVGYFLAHRALRPIHDMARRAEEITSERLDARLPVEESDGELGDLARIFNTVLSRLEQSFDQLRRFTSDASHELRTPLTVIRSVGEVGLKTSTTPAEYRDTIGSMLEEANRLTQLVENLLTISRADAGQISLQRSTFRIMDLARECSGLLDVLLEEKEQTLTITGDQEVSASGDRLLLRQALVNIVHNAIKYSPVAGVISIRVKLAEPRVVTLEIQDSGPGISAEHRLRVFDRFYRLDAGRSQAQGGAGLGLSIARWAVQAHGGDIRIDATATTGCMFVITLPGALEATRVVVRTA